MKRYECFGTLYTFLLQGGQKTGHTNDSTQMMHDSKPRKSDWLTLDQVFFVIPKNPIANFDAVHIHFEDPGLSI